MSEYQFAGFNLPTYTMVPDEIFDELLPHLTGNELKVLLYIVRRTFGFRKNEDAISLSQFSEGITKRDGTRLDSGAGVSRRGAQDAVKGLEAKSIIEVVSQIDEQGGDAPTLYRLRLGGVAKSAMGGGRNYQPGVAESRAQGRQDLPPQETDVTTNSKQEDTPDVPFVPLAEPPHFSPYIAAVITDYARELDGAHAAVGVHIGRAMAMWATSGLSEAAFVDSLHQAKASMSKAAGRRSMAGLFERLQGAV